MLKQPLHCVLLVGFSLLILGCKPEPQVAESSKLSRDSKPIELLQQELRVLKIGQLRQMQPFTGTVQAEQKGLIVSPMTATAESVSFKVGQHVQKGQILIRLNNLDNVARLAQARANLLAAQAQLNQAQRVMQRKYRLLQQGFIATVEYEQSQLDKQNQTENVAVQQANLDIALKAFQDNLIKSPISGTISQRNVEVGQVVTAGQTLFEIVDSSSVEIQGQMAFNPRQPLEIGQEIQFGASDREQSYTAKVTRIVPVANANNRQIEFFAKPSNNMQLDIGVFVQGHVLGQQSEVGQIVTLEQIINLTEKPQVWVVRQNKLLLLPVKIKAIDPQQNLAVVDGLKAQDLVSTIRFNAQDQNKPVVISQP